MHTCTHLSHYTHNLFPLNWGQLCNTLLHDMLFKFNSVNLTSHHVDNKFLGVTLGKGGAGFISYEGLLGDNRAYVIRLQFMLIQSKNNPPKLFCAKEIRLKGESSIDFLIWNAINCEAHYDQAFFTQRLLHQDHWDRE